MPSSSVLSAERDYHNLGRMLQNFAIIPGLFMRLVPGEIDAPSFTFADGVANMEYLEAAYYAATEGRRVSFVGDNS